MRSLRQVAMAAAVTGLTISGTASIPASAAAPPQAPHRASSDLIKDCGKAHEIYALRDVTLDPATPEPGKPLRWKLTGTLRKAVDLDKVHMNVTVKTGSVPLLQRNLTFPEFLQAAGSPPLAHSHASAGPLVLSGTANIPSQLPRGEYEAAMDAHDAHGADFACLRAHFDFSQRTDNQGE